MAYTVQIRDPSPAVMSVWCTGEEEGQAEQQMLSSNGRCCCPARPGRSIFSLCMSGWDSMSGVRVQVAAGGVRPRRRAVEQWKGRRSGRTGGRWSCAGRSCCPVFSLYVPLLLLHLVHTAADVVSTVRTMLLSSLPIFSWLLTVSDQHFIVVVWP